MRLEKVRNAIESTRLMADDTRPGLNSNSKVSSAERQRTGLKFDVDLKIAIMEVLERFTKMRLQISSNSDH